MNSVYLVHFNTGAGVVPLVCKTAEIAAREAKAVCNDPDAKVEWVKRRESPLVAWVKYKGGTFAISLNPIIEV